MARTPLRNKERSDSCNNPAFCPLVASMAVIGGKWKLILLYHLLEGRRRYGELRRLTPGITEKMLVQQLRELEEDDIVERTVYPEVPPRVEYSLTRYGQTLKPVLTELGQWGRRYLERERRAQTAKS